MRYEQFKQNISLKFSSNFCYQQGCYMTIHITPEPEFSYVSFESNIASANYKDLISRVIKLFQPGKFLVTIFVSKVNKIWSPFNPFSGFSINSKLFKYRLFFFLLFSIPCRHLRRTMPWMSWTMKQVSVNGSAVTFSIAVFPATIWPMRITPNSQAEGYRHWSYRRPIKSHSSVYIRSPLHPIHAMDTMLHSIIKLYHGMPTTFYSIQTNHRIPSTKWCASMYNVYPSMSKPKKC